MRFFPILTVLSAALLAQGPPAVPQIVTEAGGTVLRLPAGQELAVIGPDEGLGYLLACGEHRLRLPAEVLERKAWREATVQLVAVIGQLAPADAAAGGAWQVERDALLGLHLRREDQRILVPGRLRRRASTTRRPDAEPLRPLIEAVLAELPSRGLPPLTERVTAVALRYLPDLSWGDENLRPEVVRRLVRHGWLEPLAGEGEAVITLRRRLEELSVPVAFERWEGEGLAYEQREDAFGRSLRVLTTPSGTRSETSAHTGPPAREAPGALLVRGEDGTLSLWDAFDLDRLAWWLPQGGFGHDPEAWERYTKEMRAVGPGSVAHPQVHPPHILDVDPASGDPLALHTAHGSLTLPSQPLDSAEAFLATAARVLPDAPHLDLIERCLFDYVRDGPDTSHPSACGTRDCAGDQHQTPAQLLASFRGGRLRGDCDDLAELIQVISRRSGRLGHILDFPDHNAYAEFSWSPDAGMRLSILQTGPLLRFEAKTAVEALRAAHRHFAPLLPFDPRLIPLAMRFDDDSLRRTFWLGPEVFVDAARARTMVALQGDIHLGLLMRGLERLDAWAQDQGIGTNDQGYAVERAGLLDEMDRHAEAARLRQALLGERPTVDEIFRRQQLMKDLWFAGQVPEARRRTDELGAFLLELDPSEHASWFTWCGQYAVTALIAGDDPRVPFAVLAAAVARAEPQIRTILERENPRGSQPGPEFWKQRSQEPSWLEPTMRLENLQQHICAALRLLAEKREHRLLSARPDTASLQVCLDFLDEYRHRVGTVGLVDGGWRAWRMACFGLALDARMGREAFLDLVEARPGRFDVRSRGPFDPIARLAGDLRRARHAPGLWQELLSDELRPLRPEFSKRRILRITAGAEAAARYCEKEAPWAMTPLTTRQLPYARAVAALLQGEDTRWRKLLEEAKATGDSARRNDLRTALVACARHLEMEAYATGVRSWHAVWDHPASAFAIVWGTHRALAPQHARRAAELACEHWPDREDFRKEAAAYTAGQDQVR